LTPYTLTEPTCLSFSGGRTSAFMLHEVLRCNADADVFKWLVVCFANTGKEEEATLRFVRECGIQWGVGIHWLEWTKDGYNEVTFDTASRNGEPFESLIRHRSYLPNPVTRFCTSELKIRTMHRFLRANWESFGWDSDDMEWNQMIGIRADESRRVAKIKARGHSTETVSESMLLPLASAGVTVGDVQKFWDKQSFHLELATYKGRTLAGNCDLCFLKPAAQLQSLINEKPQRAVWWARMESLALASKPSGDVFRADRPSYSSMLANAESQVDMYGYDEDQTECFCGD